MQSAGIVRLSEPLADALVRSGEQFERTSQRLASSAGQEKHKELRKAAHEFESLFVGYLLKVMRETIQESGASESGFGREIYSELFDQELARSIGQHGALGIAEILIQRLEGGEPVSKPANPATPGEATPESKLLPDQGSARDFADIPDFQLPVRAPVSSGFGVRRDPFTHRPALHNGIDIAAPEGTDVQSVLPGRVVSAGFEPGYGNTILVRHAAGIETRYAHLGTIRARTGDVVEAHQVLGSVGKTGHSTGPHLHFEVMRLGQRINPEEALAD